MCSDAVVGKTNESVKHANLNFLHRTIRRAAYLFGRYKMTLHAGNSTKPKPVLSHSDSNHEEWSGLE
jgi:hypothetical protein